MLPIISANSCMVLCIVRLILRSLYSLSWFIVRGVALWAYSKWVSLCSTADCPHWFGRLPHCILNSGMFSGLFLNFVFYYIFSRMEPACVSGYGLISELVEIRHKLDLFSSSRLHIPEDFWICETLCVLTLYLKIEYKIGGLSFSLELFRQTVLQPCCREF